MDDIVVEPKGSHEPHLPKTPRKAAFSAWIGSALEYYDFFIYGSAAALVFPKIFFPAGNPTAATIASLATFGAAYVARPVGSFIFGHLADTIGRKQILVVSLLGMGIATFLIGCLPTFEQIGYAAPIILLILRLVQGLMVAGEGPSSATNSMEHSGATRRAFYTSFSQAGAQGGNILASGAFLLVALLPDAVLYSWGWRIPFLLSAVVVLSGWWIRRNLNESPAFEEELRANRVPKAPIKILFKNYTPAVIKVVFASLAGVCSTLFGQFALAYGTSTMGLSKSLFLWMALITYCVAMVMIPLVGMLADRVGRKPVYSIGVISTGVVIWPFLWAISERNVPLIWIFGILLIGVCHTGFGGAIYALFNEQFDTRVRTSGVAIGTQIGFAATGFALAIAAALAGANLANWIPVAIFGSVAAIVAAIASLTMREAYRTPMYDLGLPAAARDASQPTLTQAP